jgi:hypothetical protein
LTKLSFSYLSKYRREKVDEFMKRVADFNAEHLSLRIDALASTDRLDMLLPAVSYHIFYNLEILAHSKIWTRIRSRFPIEPINGWPIQAPPTLIPLLLSDEHQIWAESQLRTMKLPNFDPDQVPIQFFNYQQTYAMTLTTLARTSGDLVTIAPGSPLYEVFGNKSSALLWSRVHSLVKNCREITSTKVTAQEQTSGDAPKFTTLMGITVSHLSRNDEGM